MARALQPHTVRGPPKRRLARPKHQSAAPLPCSVRSFSNGGQVNSACGQGMAQSTLSVTEARQGKRAEWLQRADRTHLKHNRATTLTRKPHHDVLDDASRMIATCGLELRSWAPIQRHITGGGAKNSGPNPRSFSEFRPNSYQEMTVNDGCQCAGGAFSQNYGPPESSGSHRRPRFPNLRNVFANLQSYHRDLCIDTLPTCST